MRLNTYIFITTLIFFAGCDLKNKSVDLKDIKNNQTIEVDNKGLSHKRAILRTIHGNIEFKFYSNKAPTTTTRIIELIQKDFYNGLQFFKVYPNFIIQTGDPTNKGNGGSGKKIIAEFNNIQHVKGTVAMARGKDEDSADSQFYITLTTLPHLDKKYTVFGQVITGLNILTKITKGDKIISISIKD